MLGMERELKAKWTDKILGRLEPYHMSMSFLAERWHWANYWREWQDLFGDARWGTLRGHATNLDKVVKNYSDMVPWKE